MDTERLSMTTPTDNPRNDLIDILRKRGVPDGTINALLRDLVPYLAAQDTASRIDERVKARRSLLRRLYTSTFINKNALLVSLYPFRLRAELPDFTDEELEQLSAELKALKKQEATLTTKQEEQS